MQAQEELAEEPGQGRDKEPPPAPSPKASPSKGASLARALSGRIVAGPVLSCLTAPRPGAAGADEAEVVSTPYADSVVLHETPM